MKHLSGNTLPPYQSMADGRLRSRIIVVVMVVIALLSITVMAGHFSSPDTYHNASQKLDEKRDTVLALTAASATASAALTLIPDDTCTPIAEQLADISKNFTFVVAALLLEKYLLTIIGFGFFAFVVPVCCVLFAVAQFIDRNNPTRQHFNRSAVKLLAFGLVLFLATPTSVFITSKIDETYKDSIDEAVQSAQYATETITNSVSTDRKEAENLLEVLGQGLEDLKTTAGSLVNGANDIIEWIKGLLGSFVEAFAVMIVTSIVIPILVPIVIYLAFKVLIDQQPIIVQSIQPTLPPGDHREDSSEQGER